jgi:Flp pilus assembly protein TadG
MAGSGGRPIPLANALLLNRASVCFRDDRTAKNAGGGHQVTIPSGRRGRLSSGGIIVECAFTLIPLLAVIFAFADLALMLFRWSTLENAVREGCRYAITFQTSGTLGQDASIEQVVQKYALGVVTTGDQPQHIFVDYFAPGNLTTPVVGGGNVPGNIVQVSVQNVSWSWIAPLSGALGTHSLYASQPLTLSAYSSDMLGGYPAGVNSVPR